MSTPRWLLPEALEFCTLIEWVCPQFGYHVALTGGLLYKTGSRADCDIVFYRIRSGITIAKPWEMVAELVHREILDAPASGSGWRYVGKSQGRKVDLLFPENWS